MTLKDVLCTIPLINILAGDIDPTASDYIPTRTTCLIDSFPSLALQHDLSTVAIFCSLNSQSCSGAEFSMRRSFVPCVVLQTESLSRSTSFVVRRRMTQSQRKALRFFFRRGCKLTFVIAGCITMVGLFYRSCFFPCPLV
jgi:hypothetical protein